jgi:HK97 family phage major capsid protein
MFNLTELEQQKNHKILSIKELVDKAEKADPPPPLTEEECKIFDRLNDERSKIEEQISAVEAHNRRRQQSQELTDSLERPNGRKTKAEQPATAAASAATRITAIPATARRTGVLKAFKPKWGESNYDCELRAYRAGLWARATLFGDQRAQQKCYDLGVALDLRNAMGTNSNPDGGFLVADEMSTAIIDLREQYGIFRQNCRVWPMGSDTLLIPRRSAGVTVAALGENPSAAPSSTTPTFSMVQLVAKKCGGLSILSSEIAEDAVIDLADWLANEFAYAFALFEDQMGFIGDGTSTYLGVRGLGNLFTTTGGVGGAQLVGAVDAASGHDTFAEIDNSDLTTLMGKLPQYARMNAKWYCSSVAADVVFGRLAATAGGNTTQTLREGVGLSYLGHPIVISQVLPTSTGDLSDLPMLYFGDLSKSSALGDRRQVRVFPSNHRYMDLDQIGILGTERVDIVNHDVGDTTTGNAGPIVALVGE